MQVTKDVHQLGGRICYPMFWGNLNREKIPRTTPFEDLLIHTVVSITVPAEMTDRQVVALIAAESEILVESLSFELDSPTYPRGRTYFGFVGDVLDQIARHRVASTEWWFSEKGINMMPCAPRVAANFRELINADQELVSSAAVNGVVSKPKSRRPAKKDPAVQRIREKVRKLRQAKLSFREICDHLGSSERPPRASWKDLPWPRAYKHHTRAVTKWLSQACSDTVS